MAISLKRINRSWHLLILSIHAPLRIKTHSNLKKIVQDYFSKLEINHPEHKLHSPVTKEKDCSM
jgi:hypothetical protein